MQTKSSGISGGASTLVQSLALITGRLTLEGRLEMAATRSGRVVLHVVCLFRDHRLAWHWRGVVREFEKV